MKNLETLFHAELADIYDAEKRIAKVLPKMRCVLLRPLSV